MSKTLEEQITDWAVWYHKNADDLPENDLRKQINFLKKAIDGCLECLAIATKDIQVLEGRRRMDNKLWMPGDVRIEHRLTDLGAQVEKDR